MFFSRYTHWIFNILFYKRLHEQLRKMLKHNLSPERTLTQRDFVIRLSHQKLANIERTTTEKRLTSYLERYCKRLGIADDQPIRVTLIQNEDTLPRFKMPKVIPGVAETAADSEMGMTKKFIKHRKKSEPLPTGWILKVIGGVDQGRQYVATTSVVRIGRNADNHIYLKDPKVSRHHALIKFQGNKLFIKDLQSTNGTKVNDQVVIGEQELFPGEVIKVGETVIQLEKISTQTSEAFQGVST